MIHIKIKPFSQNQARVGKQVKTKECRDFFKKFDALLEQTVEDKTLPEGDLFIIFTFGMTMQCDYDNPIKTCQDVIADFYGIKDRRFKGALPIREKTKRGEEYIEFKILPYEDVAPFVELMRKLK